MYQCNVYVFVYSSILGDIRLWVDSSKIHLLSSSHHENLTFNQH